MEQYPHYQLYILSFLLLQIFLFSAAYIITFLSISIIITIYIIIIIITITLIVVLLLVINSINTLYYYKYYYLNSFNITITISIHIIIISNIIIVNNTITLNITFNTFKNMFIITLTCILLGVFLLSLLGSTLTLQEDETLFEIGYISSYIVVISFILLFALMLFTCISL